MTAPNVQHGDDRAQFSHEQESAIWDVRVRFRAVNHLAMLAEHMMGELHLDARYYLERERDQLWALQVAMMAVANEGEKMLAAFIGEGI